MKLSFSFQATALRAGALVALFEIFGVHASAGFDPAACIAQVRNLGFEACQPQGPNACSGISQSSEIHQFCTANQVLYSPVQIVGAKNEKTGETKLFQDISETLKFIQSNPDWASWPCYCCCP